MKQKILYFILAFFIAEYATAQKDTTDIGSLWDMSLEELMNVRVVSSAKTEQTVSEAPNVITVFTAEQLRNYNWQSINAVLYKHQGFFPSQDYDRRTAGFRGNFEGWNNNHLLMLVDGVPINDNLYGTAYTWEITPLVFTNTLEIIRGPGAALYGTNATNGVITMNTLSYGDLNKKKILLNTGFGERNTHVYDVITGFDSQNFSNITSLSFRHTNGIDYNSYDGTVNFTDDYEMYFDLEKKT